MSFQQLHRDESSVLTLVDFINRADVGMVESGCRTSLATETFQGLGILSYFFRQELQSHESAKARVLGLIDNTHAAAAEFLNDAVVRDGLADHSQMGSSCRFILRMLHRTVNECDSDSSVESRTLL